MKFVKTMLKLKYVRKIKCPIKSLLARSRNEKFMLHQREIKYCLILSHDGHEWCSKENHKKLLSFNRVFFFKHGKIHLAQLTLRVKEEKEM